MNTLIIVLIVLASIALVLVVLVQKSKGGGLSSGFSSSNAVMGVRKTTDFIEKATWGLAGFIIVMSITSVAMRPKEDKNMPKSEIGAPVTAPINNSAVPNMGTLPGATTPVPAPQTAPTPAPAAVPAK